MISFYIHLNRRQPRSPWESADLAGASAPRSPGLIERIEQERRQRRLTREYRSYLADPHCMPSPPVSIQLLRSLEPARTVPQIKGEYELDFDTEQPTAPVAGKRRLARSLAGLAAAAAVVLVPGRTAHGALGHADSTAPSGLPALDVARSDAGFGPPVTRLKGHELRSEASTGTPVLRENGRPVRVAAFHSNTPLTPHANNALVHSNTWGNHANVITPHSNTWQNHSNTAGGGTTPHTNMVPGDFIF